MSPAERKVSARDAQSAGKVGKSPKASRPQLKRAAKQQSLHPIAAARLTNRRRTRVK